MALVKSESVGVLVALESTLGTQPTAGWLQLQPNPGGIQGFEPDMVVVERDPLSPYMSQERGDVVGLNATPKLVHDLNRDLVEFFAPHLFRSTTQHSGGTGQSFFRPSAVTAGSPASWTVTALGAFAAGALVKGTGFTNAANNGLHLVAAASTGTTIKTADVLVTEVPPTNAVLEFAGWQGGAGDITLDGNGNLTSTVLDFTTIGLNANQSLIVGDPTSGAVFAFATAAYQGSAEVVSVAAHLITLKNRSWTVGAQDLGAAKTIRLLFSRFWKNVPITDGTYQEPSATMELSEPGVGAGGVTEYTYAQGSSLDSFEIDLPLESKSLATLGFIGTTVANPGTARATGAATPYAPLMTSIFNTAKETASWKLRKQSDETILSAEVNGAKIMFKSNIKARKQIGTEGAAGMIFGKFTPMVTFDAYVLANDMTRAVRANTDCTFELEQKNNDGGYLWRFPMMKLRKGPKTFAAGSSVMLSGELPGNRDPATNIVGSLSAFAYVP